MNGKLMTEKDKPKEKPDTVKETEEKKTSLSEKSNTVQKSTKKKIVSKKASKSSAPKEKKNELIDKIDPKLAKQFKERSQELKEKVHKDKLDDKIRRHTKSPVKAIIPAVGGLLLVLIMMSYFRSKGTTIDPDTIPRIDAEGEKAVSPTASILPAGLTEEENAFYTNTPENDYLKGGALAVERQKNASVKFNLPLEVKNKQGMTFRLIPDGRFIMGSPESEKHRNPAEFQHEKVIDRPFYLGKYEVTVKQWQVVMGETPVNSVKAIDSPVTSVSLDDCLKFIQKLNAGLPKDAKFQYILPSEAQWEYACRAGTEGRYSFGPPLIIDDYAVYRSNTTTRNVMKVGLKRPNPWGIFDMHGNAAEWTRTPYFMYACNERQFAGTTMEAVKKLKLSYKHLTYEQKRDTHSNYFNRKMEMKSDEEILMISCYDVPVYDGEHPENLIEPLDNFNVKTRTLGYNVGVFYHDINENRRYDKNEPIWKDNPDKGKTGHFDSEADSVIVSYARKIPEGTKGVNHGLYYNDKNQSFEWDAGEEIWTRKESPYNRYNWTYDSKVYDGDHPEDLKNLFDNFNIRYNAVGFNRGINYHDINDNGVYDLGEPVWDDHLESGTKGVYDPDADAIIVSFGKKIPAGTKGRNNGLFFNDKNKSFKWEPGEEIWQRKDNIRVLDYVNHYVFRGGSYYKEPQDMRSASRMFFERQNSYTYHGLRLAIHLKVQLEKKAEDPQD